VAAGKHTRQSHKRRSWLYILGAIVCVAAALVAWQILGVPRVSAVTPGPDTFVAQATLPIQLNVNGLAKLKNVKVTLDGTDVTAGTSQNGDTLTLNAEALADGLHQVTFTAASANMLRRDVREEWRFTVDTKAPTLQLDSALEKGLINTSPAVISGVTEPNATVTITSGSVKTSGAADAQGRFAVDAPLPQGSATVTVAVADRAGNSHSGTLDVYVDSVPPTLTVTQLAKVVKTADAKVSITATDVPKAPTVKVMLDDQAQEPVKRNQAQVLKLKDLAEGSHTLVVTAADKGGNVVTDEQVFVVDSSERFGGATLWPGAKGKDVKELQRRLTSAGVYAGKLTGVYDKKTEAAVRKYQEKNGLTADGRVADTTLTALGGHIIIDLGELSLTLYGGEKVIHTYSIAAGQPAYPTPTGSFVVVNMIVNPTWVPPDSAWAAGAEPIGPGPNNPLGTRWIGLSADGVGVHGTPDPGSIGSYASHGCIRMRIPDVEHLYTHVVVGMPVLIRR
jgi:lipoprotein-anchoring transpeptidase ErfK/SrfK